MKEKGKDMKKKTGRIYEISNRFITLERMGNTAAWRVDKARKGHYNFVSSGHGKMRELHLTSQVGLMSDMKVSFTHDSIFIVLAEDAHGKGAIIPERFVKDLVSAFAEMDVACERKQDSDGHLYIVRKEEPIPGCSPSKKADAKFSFESALIQQAIKDAVKKALGAKPVKLHADPDGIYHCFEMDGEVWTEDAAVEHILGNYSWWKEGK